MWDGDGLSLWDGDGAALRLPVGRVDDVNSVVLSDDCEPAVVRTNRRLYPVLELIRYGDLIDLIAGIGVQLPERPVAKHENSRAIRSGVYSESAPS